MSRRSRNEDLAALDEPLEKIFVDAYGDDKQLWASRQAFENDASLPAVGFVVGEPVSVIEIDYDGNERRGLTAKCGREGGSTHIIAGSDVVLRSGSEGARHVAAYRKWLGLDPYSAEASTHPRRKRQHKAIAGDLELGGPAEVVVLSIKERAARRRPR